EVVRPKRGFTDVSYEGIVRLHLIPAIGLVTLNKLTPQQVQSLLNQKAASGLSPRRVQYIHAVLRTALNQALRWGLVVRNVALLVDRPRLPKKEIEPLSAEQIQAFMVAASKHRLSGFF